MYRESQSNDIKNGIPKIHEQNYKEEIKMISNKF